METNSSLILALIEQEGVPALRVAFTLAVIMFLFAGVLIWRGRHELFDRDPDVENDVPVPSRPILPRISSTFMISRIVSTACSC